MSLTKKFTKYILGLMLSLFFLFVITHFFQMSNSGVLFFNAFIIAIISGVIASFVFTIKNSDVFTNIIVMFSYMLFNLFTVYIGPVTLDRSLSSFIYFYSAEKGSISANIFDEKYFRPYVKRRFEDGIKIQYLTCADNICRPTLKTKITYKILFPIGKLTNVMNNYYEFKDFLENSEEIYSKN